MLTVSLIVFWMMDRDRRLTYGTNCHRQNISGQAVKLADSLAEVMETRIAPLQRRFGSVAETWKRLLPAELSAHSRPTAIGSGQLTVQVDSPSYMYHLQICRSDILRELQRQCPHAGIKHIEFVVG